MLDSLNDSDYYSANSSPVKNGYDSNQFALNSIARRRTRLSIKIQNEIIEIDDLDGATIEVLDSDVNDVEEHVVQDAGKSDGFESEILGGGFSLEALRSTEESIQTIKNSGTEVEAGVKGIHIREVEDIHVRKVEESDIKKTDIFAVEMKHLEKKPSPVPSPPPPVTESPSELIKSEESPAKKIKKKDSPAKKRKADLLDDFFAFAPGKKKKKAKKLLKRKLEDAGNSSEVVTTDAEPGSSVHAETAADLNNGVGAAGNTTGADADIKVSLELTHGLPDDVLDVMSSEELGEPNNFTTVADAKLEVGLESELFANSLTTSDSYQFNELNESKRLYLLHLKVKLSDLGISEGQSELQVETRGNVKFSELIQNDILSHIRGQNKSANVNPTSIALVWVEGKTEVKPFFKPSTLRIDPVLEGSGLGFTELTILVIPKENVKNFSDIYPEFGKSMATRYLYDEDRSLMSKALPTSDIELSEDEDGLNDVDLSKPTGKRIGGENSADIDKITGSDDDLLYFIIGLKGKDNKRIEVKVTASTPILNIAKYFMLKKDITSHDASAIKLVFDDELLDLRQTVGDTELEEDFEIQVVLPS